MFKKNKIWFNLHFLSSCIFAIPILILALTGAMLSYDQQIRKFFGNKYLQVIVEDKEALSIEEILTKFAEQKPNLNLAYIKISSTKGVPVKIRAEPKDTRYSPREYIINPYSGEITSINYTPYVMLAAKRIHYFFGLHWNAWSDYGRIVVGISTFVFIFIILSGIYLYFPFIKRKFINSFKISPKNKGYKFLYNLHTALGVWLSILFLIMSLTGVYWTFTWVQRSIDPLFGVHVEKKKKDKANTFIDLSTIELVSSTNKNKIKELSLALELAKKSINNEYSTMSINLHFMHEKNRFYEFRYWDKDDITKLWQNSKNIVINMKRRRVMQTQETVSSKVFDKRKMNNIVLELHEGRFFGPVGTFVWFISCLLFLVFPVTGLLMTRHRLKRKKAT